MKRILTLLAVAICTSTAWAQTTDISWDKKKYPDYNPIPRIDVKAQKKMLKRIEARKAEGKTRPDHWNNALTNSFPPVINQSGGSCGSASRIHYMFTHEMNAARWTSADNNDNIYPTHFTWLHTKSNGTSSDKGEIAKHNGVPDVTHYGGDLYSELFGYQEDTDNDFGWMQGYSNWFNAMNNRLLSAANFADPLNTEEGREMVKNYLWNHCGDESYSTGGIVGVGVASGGNWQQIPKTATNDALGVTGMYYVRNWGGSVDHALTIVGYDDRIEFDLDNNGKKGEADKDEIGAWIIVNSWGGWMNKGFIYCPYAEARPTKTTTGYWTPEYYTVRRDYRPLRTLKIRMDYSRRSEIALHAGIATDLNATKPEKEVWLRSFNFCGDAKGGAAQPAPEVPMLGRWADGLQHTEPMEFGYDLTDLVAGIDPETPLKYFFWVETRSWAAGEGHIYDASILDYAIDRNGLETKFVIPEGGTPIANAGAQTTITTVARGTSVPEPRNLGIDGNTLTWQAPATNTFDVQSYNIYKDGEKLTNVEANTLSASIEGEGSYTVSAVYSIYGYTCESNKSIALEVKPINTTTNAVLRMLNRGQLSIPNFNASSPSTFTIEFWIYPDALSTSNDVFGLKATSGKFFFKINKNQYPEVGFDGGDYGTGTRAFSTGKWQHVAIVVDGGNIKVYISGVQSLNFDTGWSNTVGSVANLLVGKTEGTTASNKQTIDAFWNGRVDEFRIWNKARTRTEITASMRDTYVYPTLQPNITHYYKMNTREDGDTRYLVDAIAGHDATITSPTASTVTSTEYELSSRYNPLTHTESANFSFSRATAIIGQAIKLIDSSAPSTTAWEWTLTGSESERLTTNSPVVVFNTIGEQTVKLVTTNLNGNTAEVTKTIEVAAAEQPKADFTMPTTSIAAGDHITFINTSTPLDDATYRWTLVGADQEDVRTTNAGATYSSEGKYKVKLTATNAAGSDSVEKEIEVVKVAPQTAFSIKNNVVVIGEKIYLEDESLYDPDEWTWTIKSDKHTIAVIGQKSSIMIDKPGVYDVTLRTSNEIGSNSLTRAKAITVCNANGHTGLKFDNVDDEVVAPSPFSGRVTRFTIDFWLYPGTLTDGSLGIGDGTNMQFSATDDGSMVFTSGTKTAKSIAGFIVPNEWHHYAVTFNLGTLRFYRDGLPYAGDVASGVASITKLTELKLGGSAAPMNAIIDELRVWDRAMGYEDIQKYANGPIEEPKNTIGLILYYDFNQSCGDVVDKGPSGLNGTRNNFGPDGDAWTNTKGIFYLSYGVGPTDITDQYLKNYKAPFITTAGTVNPTNASRFKRLAMETAASPWKQENSVVDGDTITQFHVDTNKGNYLTMSTGWDNFAEEVNNLKLYQEIELPAGAYEFATYSDKETNVATTYIVVAEGSGLPDFNDLSTQAIAYCRAYLKCVFVLAKPTKVSIGFLSNQSGQKCHTIQQMMLAKSSFESFEANGEDAIEVVESEVSATKKLQAFGGLGSITIQVTEPQDVNVYTLSGQNIWSNRIERSARIPARRGIYIVNGQKVMVK